MAFSFPPPRCWSRIIRQRRRSSYRALLGDILDQARSPAYGHGARYLAKLDAMGPQVDDAAGIETHERYREALTKKHGRKRVFGASSNRDRKADIDRGAA